MSELFFGYEQEFVKCLSQTERKVESLVSQPNTKQELAFSDIRLELSEVERQLKFMETESSSMAPHVRPKFHQKVVKYKREYNQLRRKITRQEEQYAQEKNKQMLMGARLDEQQQGAKEKFLKDGQLLSDATYKLKEGVRVIRDTEGISNDVQIELVSHTNRLGKNKEKVLGIHEDLTESQQILTKMAAIMRRNKLVLGVVLGAIILAAIIILSIVLINKNKAAAAAAANNGGTGK